MIYFIVLGMMFFFLTAVYSAYQIGRRSAKKELADLKELLLGFKVLFTEISNKLGITKSDLKKLEDIGEGEDRK